MLTNIYYYHYYQPYMVKSASPTGSSTTVQKKSKQSPPPDGESKFSFLLNKALTGDVIRYARDITKNIVGVKDSAKYTIRDMEDLNENIGEHGLDTVKDWLTDDLRRFADTVNQTADFSERQSHSQSIKQFSQDVSESLMANQENLSPLGLEVDEDGRLSFSENRLDEMTKRQLRTAVNDSVDTFRDVYDQTTGMLSIPMSDHMQFKDLRYYYNYKLGSMYQDTFRIIEAGMIVDKAI